MSLSDRKKLILAAIINDYIKTAEPVGSKMVALNSEISLSSATIRNEMSELEDMGFLEKTHTSSGRVPSSKGYRVYVDEIMSMDSKKATNYDEIASIKIQELDKLIEIAGKLITKLTDYTSVVISPTLINDSIIKFEIIQIDSYSAVILIVTSAGVVKNKLVKTDFMLEKTSELAYFLNQTLTQVPIEKITHERLAAIFNASGYNNLLPEIAEVISEIIMEKKQLHLEGTSKILNFPEYQNTDKAKKLLDFISNTGNLPSPMDIDGVQISIGSENGEGPMQDTSVIYARYKIGEMGHGLIGIVGPTRMDYSALSSQISSFAEKMGEIINNSLIGDEKNDR